MELSSASFLLEAHLASFYHLFSNCHCHFCCSLMLLFVLIALSVQTCCLCCHFCLILVRSTVTDSLNLLSLLLELLSLPLLVVANTTICTLFLSNWLIYRLFRSSDSSFPVGSFFILSLLLGLLLVVSTMVATPSGSLRLEHWPLVHLSGFVHTHCLPQPCCGTSQPHDHSLNHIHQLQAQVSNLELGSAKASCLQ